MDPTISRKNYDPSTNLNWHRKVSQHPDPATSSLAEAFCQRVAAWLAISPPAIFWFEEASFDLARDIWSASPRRNSQTVDPLAEDSEYFRWPNPYGFRGPARFNGYTHRASARGIMINDDLRGEGLLSAVAHECFHIYQDSSHPENWRAESGAIVEIETEAWVSAKEDEIQSFLKQWPTLTHRG
jgi:hypothetical protein